MTLKNYIFLKLNEKHWDTLRKAQFIAHLNQNEKDGMERVMREEFAPNYRADLWCPTCVTEMVQDLYTRFDAWKAANVDECAKLEQQLVKASFPAVEPAKTAAL
jgi:hypothetical protein